MEMLFLRDCRAPCGFDCDVCSDMFALSIPDIVAAFKEPPTNRRHLACP